MRNVVKVRLYPTDDQKRALAKAFGSVRWVWNYCLALNNETYKATGRGISRMDLKKQLPLLKKEEETAWLNETYSPCLQQAVLNLSQAFVNFFEKRAGYPRFKSRHRTRSLQYPANVKIVDDAVKFPFLGEIKANLHRQFDGQLKTVTITKTKTDKYYASLLFEDGKLEAVVSSEGKAVGIDLGVSYFCVTSDGSKYDNPRHFKKHEKNLKRKQKKLSRKQKGSNSRSQQPPASSGWLVKAG